MGLFDFFNFAKDLVAQMGYVGVFLGTFLESVFPPIPSEVIMGFSGFLISEGRFTWVPTIVAALAGNALSVSLIWFLGKTYGEAFILRWGKYVGVTKEEVDKGKTLFEKHGYKMVLFCQMIPMARTLIAFPAGTLKTQYWKFILANSTGAGIWLTILTIVGYGYNVGDNWEANEKVFKSFEYVILGLFGVVVLFFLYKFYKHKENQNTS